MAFVSLECFWYVEGKHSSSDHMLGCSLHSRPPSTSWGRNGGGLIALDAIQSGTLCFEGFCFGKATYSGRALNVELPQHFIEVFRFLLAPVVVILTTLPGAGALQPHEHAVGTNFVMYWPQQSLATHR